MTVKRLVRDKRFWICGLFLALLVVAALFGPQLAPHAPNRMSPALRLKPPSLSHLMGTDEFGRDVLSRLISGTRLTLIVSLFSVAIAAVGGTLLGMLAGYKRGPVEMVIMRLIDLILSFPSILLALFVVTFLGPEMRNVIMTIGVLYIPRFARVMHGVTLAAREQEYVEAARSIGASTSRIILRAILPNVLAPLMIQISLAMGDAILLESSLSFLGMGPPPPAIAWGRMISESGPFMKLSPYVLLGPAVVISCTVLAFNLFGDAVRDALDPRLKT